MASPLVAAPVLSVVVPVFNEEGLIDALLSRCLAALAGITPAFELICVDDGSRDHTLARLLAWRQRDARLKVLVLSRNFGHQSAYTAGLHAAQGQYVAMMDGDLQDPPELLPAMYQLLATGQHDIAYGHRTDRAEDWGRRVLIKAFHGIFSSFSKLQEADNVGNFSMLSRRALTAFLSLHEKNRYLPGLRSFIGFRQVAVPYARQARHDGTLPKMSYKRLFALALRRAVRLFQPAHQGVPLQRAAGDAGIFGSGHLRGSEQAAGHRAVRVVVAGAEHLLRGLHSAAFFGYSGRVCFSDLP